MTPDVLPYIGGSNAQNPILIKSAKERTDATYRQMWIDSGRHKRAGFEPYRKDQEIND
jgi:hypothetical protein